MHVFVCASVCEFRGRHSIKEGGGGGEGGREGGNVKPRKNSIFLKKNGKTVILVGNKKLSRYLETDFIVKFVS